MGLKIEGGAAPAEGEPRNTWLSMWRGWRGRCPACGEASLYSSFLKVEQACPACRTELHHHRADDAPPYFTMVIVGHIVIGGVLALERFAAPSELLHLLIWLPLTVGLSLWLLPKVKGALIGLQWALRMHGFGAGFDPAAPEPVPAAGAGNAKGGR